MHFAVSKPERIYKMNVLLITRFGFDTNDDGTVILLNRRYRLVYKVFAFPLVNLPVLCV